MKDPKIWLITGQPGTGKSYLANQMKDAEIVDVVIDGDQLRSLDNPGYDRAGRLKNVDRAHAIASFLASTGQRVAVALIQPYREQREAMKRKGAIEIAMVGHYGVRSDYWVEDYEPTKDAHLVDPEIGDVAAFVRSYRKRPRATFIGRYQTFHDGHRWLIDRALKRGDPVLVLVRDTDEEKPAEIIAMEIEEEYRAKGADLIARSIPNVKSVEYGRGVGYEIIEHEPPEEIGEISGTKIRAGKA